MIIGVALERHGIRGNLRGATAVGGLKLALLPALVLVAGRWVAGLHGIPLATIVLSTFAFAAAAPFWLAVVAAVG